jgi:CelD/BcsL family acetyltransferase involved in cellulose biosynthesis/RimJ/RimL family protein N-acetyltransferase
MTTNTIYHPRKESQDLLDDEAFLNEWRRLYKSCTWATAFQSLEFVTTWYDSYKEHYSPILICERSLKGELVGLIPLALENRSKAVVVAGAHQAEYQAWLALPGGGNSFIEDGMNKLAREVPTSTLRFRYIPPGTPMEWTKSRPDVSWKCEIAQHSRYVVRIDNEVEVADYLQKRNRHTKNFWNRFKRLGDIRLEEIRDPRQLAPIFDQLITYYDIRLGAAYDKLPFRNDPVKKSFHLAMLGVPNLLHVSIFKAGETIISALFGIVDGKTYSLAMPMFSPQYADNSPIMLHLLLLSQRLHQEGFSTLDLTAGDEWYKERVSTNHDYVHEVEVYFRQTAWVRHRTKKLGTAIARAALRAVRVDPKTARRQLERLAQVPFGLRPSALAGKSAMLLRRICSTVELRVYALETRSVPCLKHPAMDRDRLVDLLEFEPAVGRARQDFLAEALKRIAKGHHCYTRVENHRLLHRGWSAEVRDTISSPKMAQEFRFRPGSVVFYDSFTDPRWRGRGLYTSALYQMLCDAIHIAGAKQVYVAVTSDNQVARHVIEKLGFSHLGTLFGSMRFGPSHDWVKELSAEERKSTVKWVLHQAD